MSTDRQRTTFQPRPRRDAQMSTSGRTQPVAPESPPAASTPSLPVMERPVRPVPVAAPSKPGSPSPLPGKLPTRPPSRTAPLADERPAVAPVIPAAPAPEKQLAVVEGKSVPEKAEPASKAKGFRQTVVDDAIIKVCYCYGRITLPQLVRALGSVVDNKRARVNELVRKGYIGAEKVDTMTVYYATKKGLDSVGIDDRVMQRPAASSMAHSNKLNTIIIGLSIGDEKFNELAHREVDRLNVDIAAKNKRIESDNRLLTELQSMLRAKPLLRAGEKQVLDREPKPHVDYYSYPALVACDKHDHGPKFVLHERAIRKDINDMGDVAARINWQDDVQKLLDDKTFPVRDADVSRKVPVTDAEKESMEAVLSSLADGNGAYVFQHWNTQDKPKFEHMHRPDGVIVRPHRKLEDGTIVGDCVAIEMEDNKKPVKVYVRLIKQTRNHPVFSELRYYTEHRQIATRLKQAKAIAIKEIAFENDDFNLSHEQKLKLATEEVESLLTVMKPHYINTGRKSRSGYWG